VTALLLSLALVAFLLSLPFPTWHGSGNLRRLAALCALLGLAPLILLSVFHSLRECRGAGEVLPSILSLLFLSFLAYGVLAFRRSRRSRAEPRGRRPSRGKRLVDEPRRSASDSDPSDDFS
jgi:hypothetical protein